MEKIIFFAKDYVGLTGFIYKTKTKNESIILSLIDILTTIKIYAKDKFEILNKIQIPIFMRWGSINEFILQDTDDLVKLVESKIKNNKKEIYK